MGTFAPKRSDRGHVSRFAPSVR